MSTRFSILEGDGRAGVKPKISNGIYGTNGASCKMIRHKKNCCEENVLTSSCS